jgi:hypothetical protein
MTKMNNQAPIPARIPLPDLLDCAALFIPWKLIYV